MYLKEKVVFGLAPPFGVEFAEAATGVGSLSVLSPESMRSSRQVPLSKQGTVGSEQRSTNTVFTLQPSQLQ